MHTFTTQFNLPVTPYTFPPLKPLNQGLMNINVVVRNHTFAATLFSRFAES